MPCSPFLCRERTQPSRTLQAPPKQTGQENTLQARPSRTVRHRNWRSLLLAGTAASVATGQLTMSSRPLWADAVSATVDEGGEGGEGGEGAAPEAVPPATASLIDLGKIESRLLAAHRLLDPGETEEAIALVAHPEAEFMDDLRARLEAQGAEDPSPAVETLHAQEGKTALFDTLARTRSNLLRMWAGD